MQVAVTGGTGFLGRALIQALVRRGDSVRTLVRRDDAELRRLGAQQVLGDITDSQAIEQTVAGADIVFHTAAISGLSGPWQTFYEVNTCGTRNVTDACHHIGVRGLVYTSSPSVTFTGDDQCNVDERAPYATRWLSHYPRSKALAEQLVLQAHGDRGLATCALRPHLIWGPGDRHLVPRLLARARRGQLVQVGAGNNWVDTVYIDNAVDAHLSAGDRLTLQSIVGGKAYFINQGKPVNCWDWIADILARAGAPPIRRRVSFRTAWWVGALLENVHALLRLPKEPRMTRFLAAQLARSHYFDTAAARRDLGYSPKVSMEDGMTKLEAWIRSGAHLTDGR